jgi:very-short-patch-repair endonuclease
MVNILEWILNKSIEVNMASKEIREKILKEIRDSNGIRASHIASRLGLDKKLVNGILYGELKSFVSQDKNYYWNINNNYNQPNNVQETNDTPLSRLCRYYLDAINLDDNAGVRVFANNKYSSNYIDLESLNFDSIKNDMLEKLKSGKKLNKTTTNYIGYPTLLEKVYSSKQQKYYYFVSPVLIFEVSDDGGEIVVNTKPRINPKVVKKFSLGEKNSAIYDLIKLEDQLGLDNKENPGIDELIARMIDIKSNWNWQEEINTYKLSKTNLANTYKEGIYNKCILLATEKQPFTKGLEKELNTLAKMSESDYEETALYDWVNNILSVQSNSKNIEIFSAVPMNMEQESCVKKALTQKLSVVTGPPGTGKSQVVTNILANIALNKKSCLFASKNNKAVDVVEIRVNSLSDRSILFRVGSNEYAQKIVDLIQSFLSIMPTQQDKDNYDYISKEYNLLKERLKGYKYDKKNVVKLRNEIDELEQKIEGIRKYYDIVNYSSYIEYKNVLNNTIYGYSLLNKKNHKLWTRLFWNKNKKTFYSDFENLLIEYNKKLEELNIRLVDMQSDELINKSFVVYKTRLTELNSILKYKKKLHELNDIDSVVDIDAKIYKCNQQILSIANKFWKQWVKVNTSFADPQKRAKLTEYLAVLRLHIDDMLKNTNYYNKSLHATMHKIREDMAETLSCWAVTSLSAHSRVPMQAGLYDLLIIDEASQCDISSVLPLLYRAKRAIIIGDPKQLTHISSITKQKDAILLNQHNVPHQWSYATMSLFDVASGLVNSENMVNLKDHYRSHADIVNFSNDQFYDNTLRVATKYEDLKLPAKEKAGVRWIDSVGLATVPSNNKSIINKEEAIKIVNELKRLVIENNYEGTIGVVTPFRAQADYIIQQIRKNKQLHEQLSNKNQFIVDTVHKFQGDEKDIMIFSTVISKGISKGSLNFLSSTGNIFNVAITRARSILIIVGNKQACLASGVNYIVDFANYIQDIEESKKKKVKSKETIISHWEGLLLNKLKLKGIKVIQQYPVDKYSLDLAIIIGDKKLDIEVDGEMYHRAVNGELSYKDQLRNFRLFELGWDVKRFWVYQVRDSIDICVKDIENWVEQASQLLDNSLKFSA